MSSTDARMTASATLVIEKFSQMTSYGYVFLPINGLSSNYFGFHPNTVVYSDEYVSIFLMSLRNTFKYKANVSILNLQNEKLFIKEYFGEFKDVGSKYDENYFSLMSRSELLLPQNGYLFNDKLTLLCELEVLEDGENQKTTESIREDFRNLSENFQFLLTDGKFTDATLVVGKDGKEFHVHKNILSARSSVFAAMFEHDCEEKRLNKVNITDMDEEVCAEMLQFVYSGKVKELEKYAMELLQVADKYQLDSLKTICEQYLSSHLSIESAANVLILADMHRSSELKLKCLDYIWDNATKVKATEGWEKLKSTRPLLGEFFDHLTKKYNK